MFKYFYTTACSIVAASLLLSIAVTFVVPRSVGALSASAMSNFAAAGSCNSDVQGIGSGAGAFIFVPWYKYLDCTDGTPDTSGMPLAEIATKIIIAVIELLTRLAGLVAVGFIIYGSILYITSQGEPNGLNNAKSTISNATIGFVIVVLAVGAIQFLGRAIG